MIKLNTFMFNDIINKNVYDEFDECIGVIKDIYTTSEGGSLRVIGYKIKKANMILDYEFRIISFMQKDNGKLKIKTRGSREILPRSYSYLILKDLYNKKVVDLTTKTVVKVCDLYMVESAGEIRINEVKCSAVAKYGDIKGGKLLEKLTGVLGIKTEQKILRCDEIQVIDLAGASHGISSRFNKLSTMHPADLADIIEDLDVVQRKEIFDNLDEDLIADTLEEVDQEMKGEIIKELSDDKVVEILESMPNDEIADMLDDLNDEEREKLLVNLQNEDAEEVKELLKYDDKIIGSIMNTDYISVSLDITIQETIALIKEMEPDEEVLNNIYITDIDGCFKGAVSIRDLILNSTGEDKKRKLSEFINSGIKSLNYKDYIIEAIEAIDKYDMLSIPVLDDDKKLVGCVLIHDLIDEELYPAWKKKSRLNKF